MTLPREDPETTDLWAARRAYLDEKRARRKESTVRSYSVITRLFVEFCEEKGVTETGEVSGHVLASWKGHRQSEVKPITLKNNIKHLRNFFRYCEDAELMAHRTHAKLKVPDVADSEARSHETMKLGQAEDTLRYLKTYKYGSRQHALLQTMWHTGCRISGARALDVTDLDQREGDYLLRFRNRESQGTPLKNGESSRRNVTINQSLWDLLHDYIRGRREGVTDEWGREPLFTTPERRVSRERAYKNIVGYTRPCVSMDVCPHDRDIESCEAAQSKSQAPSCPSSRSLHPVRRGSITNHLNQGWPKEKLSERVDVSVAVLEKHYDARTDEQEREGRRQFVDLL